MSSAVVWITDSTWQACVDAARAWIPAGSQVVLLAVTSDEAAEAVHSSYLGLLGRHRPDRDPSARLEALDAAAAAELLEAAASRLGRPATPLQRHGRVEREVVRAAEGAELLICARDGAADRLGPRSLAPPTRFVVDHAPCPVLLIWPGPAPPVSALGPRPHR
jgi:nucleotide-binding universal stress UspA family protein